MAGAWILAKRALLARDERALLAAVRAGGEEALLKALAALGEDERRDVHAWATAWLAEHAVQAGGVDGRWGAFGAIEQLTRV